MAGSGRKIAITIVLTNVLQGRLSLLLFFIDLRSPKLIAHHNYYPHTTNKKQSLAFARVADLNLWLYFWSYYIRSSRMEAEHSLDPKKLTDELEKMTEVLIL